MWVAGSQTAMQSARLAPAAPPLGSVPVREVPPELAVTVDWVPGDMDCPGGDTAPAAFGSAVEGDGDWAKLVLPGIPPLFWGLTGDDGGALPIEGTGFVVGVPGEGAPVPKPVELSAGGVTGVGVAVRAAPLAALRPAMPAPRPPPEEAPAELPDPPLPAA